MTRIRDSLTDHQYETLQKLAAGVHPPNVAVLTRRYLVRRGYVTAERTKRGWRFAITDAGRHALAHAPRQRPLIPKGLL